MKHPRLVVLLLFALCAIVAQSLVVTKFPHFQTFDSWSECNYPGTCYEQVRPATIRRGMMMKMTMMKEGKDSPNVLAVVCVVQECLTLPAGWSNLPAEAEPFYDQIRGWWIIEGPTSSNLKLSCDEVRQTSPRPP